MLGMLLITWENGSTVKTYGVNRSKIYNMKFTFISIVIIISCSVCASGDLEIYPGLKFDLSSGEPSEETSLYGDVSRRWPWQSLPQDDYEGGREKSLDFSSLSERLRDFKEFLNRNHQRNDEELPFYSNPKPNFEDTYNEYRNLEKAQKLNGYRFRNPQILDDVRPYPHEDDFTFGEDEEEEDVDDVKSQSHAHKVVGEYGNLERSHSEEASGKGALEEAKFVEDPTEFAYLPTDPRFFQNADSNDVPKVRTKPKKLRDSNAIGISQRSEEPMSEEVTFDSELSDDQKGDGHVSVVAVRPQIPSSESAGVYIIAVVAGISAAATVGLIAVGIGWYNLQKHVKNASDVEYPAYGVTGPNKDASPSGDRRLAQSAQMYHYQHQKQQIIAMESRAAAGDRHGSVSEADSDEENEEGDYTVYECPGLAPTGEMEVKNPLFQDDPTPARTPPVKPNEDGKK